MCKGLKGHSTLKKVLFEELDLEYRRAKDEFKLLQELFRDCCWYSFEAWVHINSDQTINRTLTEMIEASLQKLYMFTVGWIWSHFVNNANSNRACRSLIRYHGSRSCISFL